MDKEQAKYIKSQLWFWGGVTDYCRRKQEEMQEIIQLRDEMTDTLQARITSGMPRGNKTGDPTALAVEKTIEYYNDAIQRIKDDISGALGFKARVDVAIAILPQEQGTILQLRYGKGYQWEYIALKVHASRSACFDSHYAALKSLDFSGLFR